MDFRTFWFGMSQDERAVFADDVNRSQGYLQLIAGEFRKASPALANTIHEKTGGKVTREEVRPDVFAAPSHPGRDGHASP